MGFGWKDFNSDLILLWFYLGNFSLETRENDKIEVRFIKIIKICLTMVNFTLSLVEN